MSSVKLLDEERVKDSLGWHPALFLQAITLPVYYILKSPTSPLRKQDGFDGGSCLAINIERLWKSGWW